MCPEGAGVESANVEERAGMAQAALAGGELPEICWGQSALEPKRDSRVTLGGRAAVVLGGLLLVAVAAGVAVATRASGGTKQSGLAQVAYVTSQSPGFRFEMTVTGSLGEQGFELGGSGSMDERAGEGTMNMQFEGRPVDEIVKSPYIYVSIPGAAGTAVWEKANLDAFTQTTGASGGPLGSSSSGPAQMLSLLKAGGALTTVGDQSIRGVSTTHYHALIDFNRYAAMLPAAERAGTERYAQLLKRITGSSSLPIDLWVDSAQRVRRFSTQLHSCTARGPLTESFTMDLYDYARQPTVVAPAEATDITGGL